MKTVNVTYFKKSGKWYTDETMEIPEDVTGYDALVHEIPKRHRIEEMYMMVRDSDDGKEPYIVPKLYYPAEIQVEDFVVVKETGAMSVAIAVEDLPGGRQIRLMGEGWVNERDVRKATSREVQDHTRRDVK